MTMPGRNYTATNQYRYGFNGQEKSDELDNGLYTAQFWEYDSRIGIRWNLDPKPEVGISPYNCFAGNPISNSDILGDSSRPGLLGKVQDFGEGSWNAVKNDVKGLAELRHRKTWAEMGKNIVALTIGNAGMPGIGNSNLIAFDEKFGTNLFDRNAAINQQLGNDIQNIPNMDARGWGDLTGHFLFAVASTKGLNLIGEAVSYSARFVSAEKYLQTVGYTNSFELGTAKFTFKFGSNEFAYHEAESAAMKTPWSTPQSFSSPGEAFTKLALNYERSTNFASYKFSLKNWGLFVEGKASAQGLSLGGEIQSLRTPFSLKTQLRPKYWWRK